MSLYSKLERERSLWYVYGVQELLWFSETYFLRLYPNPLVWVDQRRLGDDQWRISHEKKIMTSSIFLYPISSKFNYISSVLNWPKTHKNTPNNKFLPHNLKRMVSIQSIPIFIVSIIKNNSYNEKNIKKFKRHRD